MKSKIDFYADGIGKIIIDEEKDEWHFNVFHYFEPLKNYIYVATISVDEFKTGLEEAIMFLSFDLHAKIYHEENS